MQIAMHKHARTSPLVRAQLLPAMRQPVFWPSAMALTNKPSTNGGSGRASKTALTLHPPGLQTQLTPAHEIMVVHLLRTLLLPLDDLLAVTRKFICNKVSLSGLDQCVRRQGVGNLSTLTPAEPTQPHKARSRAT